MEFGEECPCSHADGFVWGEEGDEDVWEEALEIVRCCGGEGSGEVGEGCCPDGDREERGYPGSGEEGWEGERVCL